jgi:hypothetical protein
VIGESRLEVSGNVRLPPRSAPVSMYRDVRHNRSTALILLARLPGQ